MLMLRCSCSRPVAPLAFAVAFLLANLTGCPDDSDGPGGAADVLTDATGSDSGGGGPDAAPDGAGGADALVDAGPGLDTDGGAPDTTVDPDVADSATPDSGTPPDGGGDVAADAADAADTVDAEPTGDVPVTPDTSKCDYVCDMDCVCKKNPMGCDIPFCEPEGCEGLAAAAQAELTAAATGCTAPSGCTLFEYPICGSFGCFSGAVREGADVAALTQAAMAAGAGGCSGFSCGCGPPEGQPVCLDGMCRLCPPDCGSSCDALEQAIATFAAAAASGCTKDIECKVVSIEPCSLGTPATACHAFAYRVDPFPVLSLLKAYDGAITCPLNACDCQANKGVCQNGGCVPVQVDPSDLPVQCWGTPTPSFPSFDKSCDNATDCTLVFHTTDCCGTQVAWGINHTQAGAFQAAEAVCVGQYPACGCASQPTKAEDGKTGFGPGAFAVKCDGGACKSFVP